jgi:hypothetical protein
MRTLILSSLAAGLMLAALPVQAKPDIKTLPTPADLRNVVNYEIGRGGISPHMATKLRKQADNIVQLEARYAADGYSPREKIEIRRRSLYLIQSVYFQRTGRTLAFNDTDTFTIPWAVPPGGVLNGPMPGRGSSGQGTQR